MIITKELAGKIATELKEKGKKIVFTNGCFDIIHAGHVEYLGKAKQLGDYLFLGLNSDASVRRLKGEVALQDAGFDDDLSVKGDGAVAHRQVEVPERVAPGILIGAG